WLASRMDWVGELSSVGGATQTSAAGFWFAARHRVDAQAVGQPLQTSITPLPYTDIGWQRQQTQCWTAPLPQPHEVGDASEYAAMQRLWHPLWGDRRQELAVIGVDMDAPRTRAVLDACLLSDQELRQGPAQWQLLDDPFPHWAR
ncbi:GTP-binding protein, partial [Xanthomonas citri]